MWLFQLLDMVEHNVLNRCPPFSLLPAENGDGT